MIITLYITKNCRTCKNVQRKISSILNESNKHSFKVYDITAQNLDNISIVPALFVGNVLYAYGEFNYSKFEERLSSGFFDN